MKESSFQVVSNRQLTDDVFELQLAGDASTFTCPGQFAEISVSGLFLRRPISVCDWTPDTLTLLVKAVGTGTRSLHDLKSGASLRCTPWHVCLSRQGRRPKSVTRYRSSSASERCQTPSMSTNSRRSDAMLWSPPRMALWGRRALSRTYSRRILALRMSTHAGRCQCFAPWRVCRRLVTDNSASKRAWDAVSGPAWVAPS